MPVRFALNLPARPARLDCLPGLPPWPASLVCLSGAFGFDTNSKLNVWRGVASLEKARGGFM